MAGHPQRALDRKRLDNLTPQSATAIWDCIHAGTSIRNTAAELGYTYAALCEWLEDPSRKPILLTARARAASALADQTIEIADNGANAGAPDPARDKLRIQSRQWLASRWDRSIYGESKAPSVEVNIGGMFLNAMRPSQVVESQQVAELPAVTVPDDTVT